MSTPIILTAVILITAIIFGVKWFRTYQERKKLKIDITNTTYKLMGFIFELEQCQKQADSIQGIVDFFALVAAWHDQVDDIHEIVKQARELEVYTESAAHLEELASLIEECGRQEYGMNRTSHGERVTKEKVYLGDIHGCWTASVAELEKKEEELKNKYIVITETESG